MKREIYESSYRKENHFSFGKNWQFFLKTLNEEKIEEAKRSLVGFLGGEDKILGKRFIDIGCGSGLFSMSAHLLGATNVVSVDIDDFSLKCTKYLCTKEGNPENWKILEGSALDERFIKSLGRYDVVYSWGVLHHTGDMWRAIRNTLPLVDEGGVFYIALYNKNEKYLLEGISDLWVKLKRMYNVNGKIVKKLMEISYVTYYFFGLIFHGINPISYVRTYSTLRGMDYFTDIRDWLGGYPYEFASVNEVVKFFSEHGFELLKKNEVRSLGCNEFLFVRKIVSHGVEEASNV